MARLVGTKGIDKDVVVDVSDEKVEEYVASGDYKVLDVVLADSQEDHGVLQSWDAHEDYSVHGVRERGYVREAEAAPKSKKAEKPE